MPRLWFKLGLSVNLSLSRTQNWCLNGWRGLLGSSFWFIIFQQDSISNQSFIFQRTFTQDSSFQQICFQASHYTVYCKNVSTCSFAPLTFSICFRLTCVKLIGSQAEFRQVHDIFAKAQFAIYVHIEFCFLSTIIKKLNMLLLSQGPTPGFHPGGFKNLLHLEIQIVL